MADRKRFQNQTLNSEDYEKTEKRAKALKKGGKIAGGIVLGFSLVKKVGPGLIKCISKIHKH